ncbi:uncharacterized protein LOC120187229 [Hibiscus syriacus]|uniref:uncharacterized protein LOC120187229 n=1 Tax=Hibiscus syriacus TaxID=106335 RepID=UPI0019213DED|nr:uncharacterized protein LOC120187229 [Hibiscus syriacus]
MGEKLSDDSTAVTRSGESVFMSVFRTKIADHYRLVTVTWCKKLLLHGLSVSVEGPQGENQYGCKVELKPWWFWRKQDSKRLLIDVCNGQVVLLVGDLKKEAYRKTGCRPALIDPVLVSRKEHIFGKKRFSTRSKFHEKDGVIVEPEMEMRIDGNLALHVQHLEWKFRGNESINVNRRRLQVYWDVHDWLFSPGLRHALFIFKPVLSSSSSSSPLSLSSLSLSSQTGSSGSLEGLNNGDSPEFCLFLYAWKIE